MKPFESEKGSIINEGAFRGGLIAPTPGVVNPRLMRAVPSNITRVIGDFDDMDSAPQKCEFTDLK